MGLVCGPISGFLLSLALETPSLVVAFGCSVAFVATLFLTGDFTPRHRPESFKDIGSGLVSAGRWCLANPFRLRMALVECTANIGVNAVLFCVDLGLAKKGVPAAKIGVLTTAAAIAFLLGALAAPRIIKRVGTGVLNIVALSALTSGALAIPFISHFPLLLVVYMLMNISLPATSGSMDAYYLSITPIELTGHVGSFMSLLSGSLAPFGIAAAGWGISEFGFKETTIGFASVVFSGWLVSVFASDVRRIPRPSEWESYIA